MTKTRRSVLQGLVALWLCAHVPGAQADPQPARAELKLAYGISEVKAGSMAVRIVRAQVGTSSASTFDTYTVYLMPSKTGEPWMHVTTSDPKGLGYNLRTYESGDANTQAIAFYREGTRLHAVQANKVREETDTAGPRTTPFNFKFFVFNENEEIPMFDNEGTLQSRGSYVDGSEALQREFFRP